ncbi:MAG: hypothetical protein ACTTH7_08590 [Treponema sp.]
MQIPLNRIEYDYVIELFMEELPALLLQIGMQIYPVSVPDYTIKRNRVYVRVAESITNRRITVFFHHKKRCICFNTYLVNENGSPFFSLPDRLYKYNSDYKSTTAVFMDIYAENKKIVTAYEHKLFPLDSVQPSLENYSAIPTDFISSYQPISLIRYRINDFELQAASIFNMEYSKDIFFLFIDSRYILCGCKKALAEKLEAHQNFTFVIHFPRRVVRVSTSGSSVSHDIARIDIKTMLFIMDNPFEEDKRFLYEKIYHEKYNPPDLILRG